MRIRVSPFNLFRLVLSTIAELEDDRRCWRLVNGILIEKNKVDLEPDLKLHISNMQGVLQSLDAKANRC